MQNISGKIGVFDSGFGGLTILKEFVNKLPEYDYIYLGDTARAPYGERSHETIFEFTKEGVEFLFKNGAEMVILACNSASAEALRKIQQEYLPKYFPDKKVLGVIIPTVEDVSFETKNKKIAVLATEATVRSCAFEREINKIDPSINVFTIPAPLLVPIVEQGEEDTPFTDSAVKKYVEEVLGSGADILILGCTHYGILRKQIEKYVGNVKVVEEAPIVAKKLEEYLGRHLEIKNSLSQKRGREYFTTFNKEKFDDLGGRFFGEKIDSQKISL